jgi:hypothetical protein
LAWTPFDSSLERSGPGVVNGTPEQIERAFFDVVELGRAALGLYATAQGPADLASKFARLVARSTKPISAHRNQSHSCVFEAMGKELGKVAGSGGGRRRLVVWKGLI